MQPNAPFVRPRTRPGQTPRWHVILETSNGRMITEAPADGALGPGEDRMRHYLREWEREPLRGAQRALGGVLISPDGEVTERWGREFDPDGPALFATISGAWGEMRCQGPCGRVLLTGWPRSYALSMCAECVYEHVDPEPRDPAVPVPVYVEPERLRSGRHVAPG